MSSHTIVEGPDEKKLKEWREKKLEFKLEDEGEVVMDIQTLRPLSDGSYKIKGESYLNSMWLSFEGTYKPTAGSFLQKGLITIYH